MSTDARRPAAVADVPGWLQPLVGATAALTGQDLSRFTPPDDTGRKSAVLILFGQTDGDPDLLLIERASDMRSHAGQPAFPGGAADPTDTGPEDTALREAEEETGLDRAGVTVFRSLPELWLPPSNFVVTPVLGWWHSPTPVSAVDPAEVASVHRVPIDELADPENRVWVRHPAGYVGPGFTVRDLLVWGFTGGLVDRILSLGGWQRDWESAPTVELDWQP